VKLNEFVFLRRWTEEASALAGHGKTFAADQIDALRAVQPELAQRIPEAVLRVTKLFDAPPVGRTGVIADRLDDPLTGLPAPQGWVPVIAEFVLRRDFPFQAAALAAVSETRQGAGPQTLIFQALVRHTNAAPAHHDQIWESDTAQPAPPDFQIRLRFRLFRTGVREKDEVGTDVRTGQLD